jgi:hypothetical protein
MLLSALQTRASLVKDGEWYSDIKHDNHLGVVRIWGNFSGRVESKGCENRNQTQGNGKW